MRLRNPLPSLCRTAALLLLAAAPARAAGVHVGLEPAATTVAAGATFTVRAVVSPADAAFNAFDLLVRFDNTRLQYVAGTNAADSVTTAACSNRFQIFKLLNAQPADPDTLSLNLSLLCANVSMTGPGSIYKWQFKALAPPGPTTLSLMGNTAFYNAGQNVTPVETRAMTVTVPCPVITIAPASLPGATVGAAYSQSVTAGGGFAPYTFALDSGALPAGLALSGGGAITGTPTSPGPASFSVTATDAYGCTGTRPYTITVGCPAITIGPPALPTATVGTAYAAAVTAAGGAAPYTFALASGALPAGLALAPDGTVSGTPTAAGDATFTVTATDASGCTGTAAVTLAVTCPAITIGPEALAAATAGAAYSAALTGSGGTEPYAFTLVSGALPAGLALATDGTLSGTPAAGGASATFSVTATDAYGCAATRDYTLDVACATLAITPESLPDGTAGAAYAVALAAAGGTPPYTFVLAGGALPDGLALATDGSLTGTPGAPSQAAFTVHVTDANGCEGARDYALTIGCPAIAIVRDTATAHVNLGYSSPLGATGGVAPYTFELTDGALPDGLALEDGTISGTPTTAGTYRFTLRATDANGCTATRDDSIEVVVTLAAGDEVAPLRFALESVLPNPRRPGAAGLVSFALPEAASVRIELYDAAGRLVAGRPEARFAAGRHRVAWAPRVPSGVYLARVRAGGRSAVARWIVVP